MILIGMSVIMLSASCGGFAVECAFDADCDLNEACAVGTCRQVCVMDEDCADLATSSPDAEIACRPLTREAEAEAVNVCAPPDFEENSANNDSECVTDEECVEALGSEFARCSLINTCIMPSPDYGILVRDLGEVAEGDEGVGAELLAIYVEDANGAILGWAVSLDYQPAPLATSEAQGFDGSSLVMDESFACVATPEEARGVELGGEGGSLRVYFVDEGGARLTLEDGWMIHIVERGANCGDGEVSNEYEVRLCVSRSGDAVMTETQCQDILAASVTDKATLTLDLPE